MHIQLGIWEKENLGSTGLGFADLFDPLVKYMTKVSNIQNKNAASKTELKSVSALNSFVDKTINKLTVMDESDSGRLKTLKFQNATSVMEYGSPGHRNRHDQITRSFDSREEQSIGSLPRVVEYDSPNKRKREVYATQLERGFGHNNYTDSKQKMGASPQIRINQRRNFETLRDSDLTSKVKSGPRPPKDGIRMNQLSFKIDQAKRQIDKIQKTISQPKSERQISNDAKSRRLSNDSRATGIKTGAMPGMKSNEFSMQIDSSDDDTIINKLAVGSKVKELNSKTKEMHQHTDKKNDEKHYHPNGELCNCREKMFDVKKQMREKNWQRRKTIIQQGSFIGPNQQALPDLKEKKSSQVLKEKFKNFERRLSILADTATIDKISPGLVKAHERMIL